MEKLDGRPIVDLDDGDILVAGVLMEDCITVKER